MPSNNDPRSVIDLFAGPIPGGWDLGARALGLDPVGLELDDAACATRRAAGLRTMQCDVAAVDFECGWLGQRRYGLIASPPCQAWSTAGKGGGRRDKDHVVRCAGELAAGSDTRAMRAEQCEDPRSILVVEPLRWALALEPEWVAFEQVPPVLELWSMFAQILALRGYSTWAGVLEAERYGVPQTRERAVLLARRGGSAHPPRPTHQRYVPGQPQRHEHTFDGEVLPWVSMAQALGEAGRAYQLARGEGMIERHGDRRAAPDDEPAPVITSKARTAEWVNNSRTNATVRAIDEPAPTITGGHDNAERVWRLRGHQTVGGAAPKRYATREADQPALTVDSRADLNRWLDRPATTVSGDPRIAAPGHHDRQMNDATRVTVEEAAALQTFPVGYPWDGLLPAPHVAQGLPVKDDLTLAHELIGDGLKRGVHFVVRGEIGQDGEVLQAVVVLDAIDVVNDLARLRPGDLAVLRHQGPTAEDIAAVDTEVDGLLPALVRVERVTVEPPLLPVLGAEAASDGFAFAVLARRLGGVTGPWVGGAPLADPLVVHEAQAAGGMLPVAVLDVACAHAVKPTRWTGNSRTKQFEQVGNAVPPLLAFHILRAVTGLQAVGEGLADAA